MTRDEQKRAAKSARKLAMEIVNGRRLRLDAYSYCGCAAHYVAIGAGLDNFAGFKAASIAAAFPIDPVGEDTWSTILSAATDVAVNGANQTALVFPLLATADALDALAKQASGTAGAAREGGAP